MLLRGKAFPGGARTAELCSYCRRAPSLGQRVLYFKSLLFQTCYRVQRGSKAIIVQVGTNTALSPELSVQYSPGRTILWRKAAPLCSLRQAPDAAHTAHAAVARYSSLLICCFTLGSGGFSPFLAEHTKWGPLCQHPGWL